LSSSSPIQGKFYLNCKNLIILFDNHLSTVQSSSEIILLNRFCYDQNPVIVYQSQEVVYRMSTKRTCGDHRKSNLGHKVIMCDFKKG